MWDYESGSIALHSYRYRSYLRYGMGCYVMLRYGMLRYVTFRFFTVFKIINCDFSYWFLLFTVMGKPKNYHIKHKIQRHRGRRCGSGRYTGMLPLRTNPFWSKTVKKIHNVQCYKHREQRLRVDISNSREEPRFPSFAVSYRNLSLKNPKPRDLYQFRAGSHVKFMVRTTQLEFGNKLYL